MAQHDKVNLNTANRQELAQIPGSSDECADAIIHYRNEHGGLKSIKEIENIKGFGPKAVEHFREHGTV